MPFAASCDFQINPYSGLLNAILSNPQLYVGLSFNKEFLRPFLIFQECVF